MPRPTIEPITGDTLPEFAVLLHAHLNGAFPVDTWIARLSANWCKERPNFGFLLRDAGKVVGGIGAYYADRLIRGRPERFCNITSWCVLEAYRQQSMRLAMAIINQPGYHFTDFSPTVVVGGALKFLKFRPLDERQTVMLNLPWLPLCGRVVASPAQIEQTLTGDALHVYRDHAKFAWLRHVLVGDADGWCHVIYKRRQYKALPSAHVMYLSDPQLFGRHWRRLSAHLLARGMVSTHVESRFLVGDCRPSGVRSGFNPKLYLSATLAAADIDYLYSETMALDL